ncbi:MAG: hypothetical protein LUB61_01630, partial [Eggerthellaceae bacterium]|nr:hypothetical protein [Eggerthellaceae bacterium]
MHKAIHLTHKALSVAVAFLLAAAMAVGFSFTPLVQDTQAYAAESTDIADAGIENCGTQYNISWWADDSYTSIPSAEAYKGSTTTSDGTVLYEGTDYTVTYDFSKVPSYSCAGDCSATLTGMGDYTGEVTFDYEVQAFTTIETGVGNVSVMYRRGFNELLESVDNSTPLMYQYDNTVVYVPAGQYITLDDFFAYYDIGECGNGEAKTWATIQNVNELYFNVDTTYDLETNVEGKWYPQQTTDSYSTEGPTSVPCIYARQYGLKHITTTAEAA